jgi:hypothetical protein
MPCIEVAKGMQVYLVANMTGLGAGLSSETVASAATWVSGVAVLAPIPIVALSLVLLKCHRMSRDQSDPST